MARKKLLSLVLGLLISAFFLFLIFRNVDVNELGAALKNANYLWLIPNVCLAAFAMFQRAERWKYMIKPISTLKFKKLLSATCIGFMANNVLPFRLGEFVRAYALARNERNITKSASLATIFVERMVFDLLALLLILTVILFFIPIPIDEKLKYGIIISLVTAVVGLIFAVVLVIKPEGSGRLITRYLFFLPEKIKTVISTTIVKFSRGLLFLKNWRHTAWVSGHTIFLWLCMGIANVFVFRAFGFDLPIYASYVLLVVVSIIILVPQSPGFIGPFHWGVYYTLHFFDVPDNDAKACAIVLHAAQFIPITLMGFYYLWKEGLSLRYLEKAVMEEQDAEK